MEATNFVKTVEQHQHRKIACLEEIAYLNEWISKEEVLKVYELFRKALAFIRFDDYNYTAIL